MGAEGYTASATTPGLVPGRGLGKRYANMGAEGYTASATTFMGVVALAPDCYVYFVLRGPKFDVVIGVQSKPGPAPLHVHGVTVIVRA